MNATFAAKHWSGLVSNWRKTDMHVGAARAGEATSMKINKGKKRLSTPESTDHTSDLRADPKRNTPARTSARGIEAA